MFSPNKAASERSNARFWMSYMSRGSNRKSEKARTNPILWCPKNKQAVIPVWMVLKVTPLLCMQDKEEHSCRIQSSLDKLYGTENISSNRSHAPKDRHQPCYPNWFSPHLAASCTPFDSLSQEEMLRSASSRIKWALQSVLPGCRAALKLHPQDSLYQHLCLNTGVKLRLRSEQI